MLVNVCIAKLHRATVTGADLNYVGSITIDEALLEAAGLVPGQMVTINNASNAVSWRTYILKGEKGKGDIILNGPPACSRRVTSWSFSVRHGSLLQRRQR